jgi:hypothetical protein
VEANPVPKRNLALDSIFFETIDVDEIAKDVWMNTLVRSR